MAKKAATPRREGAYRIKSAETRTTRIAPKPAARTERPAARDALAARTLTQRPK